ncbi:hypothetical protein [Nostoc sp.]|uniref:hypothetical protein n=1 Tax=Nostoc sp. TaxID=1180 RepID=UPI002FF9E5C1
MTHEPRGRMITPVSANGAKSSTLLNAKTISALKPSYAAMNFKGVSPIIGDEFVVDIAKNHTQNI